MPEIIYLDTIDSTHKYLIQKIKIKELKCPIAISSDIQTDGVGSRENRWFGKKGNLYLSFCVEKKQLPKDLPIQSTSIYFSWLMKDVLSAEGSNLWLKWPNDFYLEDKKIGGTITTTANDFFICSIGINLKWAPEDFSILDINIDKEILLKKFFNKISKCISWKEIFSKYKIEFHKSKEFGFYMNQERILLKNSTLCDDGAIKIDNKKVYSSR